MLTPSGSVMSGLTGARACSVVLLAGCGDDDFAVLFLPACFEWPDAEGVTRLETVSGGLPRVFWARRRRSSLDRPWLMGMPADSRVL